MAKAASNKKNNGSPRGYSGETYMLLRLSGVLLCAMGLVVFLAVVMQFKNTVCDSLRTVCMGLAGMASIGLPVLFIWGGVLLLGSGKANRHVRTYLLVLLLFVLLCGVAELTVYTGPASQHRQLLDYIQIQQNSSLGYAEFIEKAYQWNTRYSYVGGGAVGLLAAWPFWKLLGSIPAAVLLVLGCIADCCLLLHVQPKAVADKLKALHEKHQRRAADKKQQRDAEHAEWQRQKDEQERLKADQENQNGTPDPGRQPVDNGSRDWEPFARSSQ